MKNKTIDTKVGSSNEVVILVNPIDKNSVLLNEKGKAPFSLEQNIETVLYNYEVNGDVPKIFRDSLGSTTAIAYGPRRIKINPTYEEFKDIKNWIGYSSWFDYNSLKPEEGWVELNLYDKDVKYNKPLTREEVKVHPAWLAAMNNNEALLAKFTDAWFDRTGAKKSMGFYLARRPIGVLTHLKFYFLNSDLFGTRDWFLL